MRASLPSANVGINRWVSLIDLRGRVFWDRGKCECRESPGCRKQEVGLGPDNMLDPNLPPRAAQISRCLPSAAALSTLSVTCQQSLDLSAMSEVGWRLCRGWNRVGRERNAVGRLWEVEDLASVVYARSPCISQGIGTYPLRTIVKQKVYGGVRTVVLKLFNWLLPWMTAPIDCSSSLVRKCYKLYREAGFSTRILQFLCLVSGSLLKSISTKFGSDPFSCPKSSNIPSPPHTSRIRCTHGCLGK